MHIGIPLGNIGRTPLGNQSLSHLLHTYDAQKPNSLQKIMFLLYQQKTAIYPQMKTIIIHTHMLYCAYINLYSIKSSTYLKYTSDFRQYLPKEFQFDEFNTNWRECL